MNRSYFYSAILCCFALTGFVLGDPILSEDDELEIAQEGIDSLTRGFDTYNSQLDNAVPWRELEEKIANFDRYQSDYSRDAADLVYDIKNNMLDGIDAYHRAVHSVFQWCGLAINRLNTYLDLLSGEPNPKRFNAARNILLLLLERGELEMGDGQKKLGGSAASFNVAVGQLSRLNHQLRRDFNQDSDYNERSFGPADDRIAHIEGWYKDVTEEVKYSLQTINETRKKLEQEILEIGNVKQDAVTTRKKVRRDRNPHLKKIILRSVENLIHMCEEYLRRHGRGN